MALGVTTPEGCAPVDAYEFWTLKGALERRVKTTRDAGNNRTGVYLATEVPDVEARVGYG